MISLIDKLQENESYHYIDYIPYNPENPNYLDLEEYFQKIYLLDFAEKIIRIMLKLIWCYPCHIFLTKTMNLDSSCGDILAFSDIGKKSPEQLACIIKRVILDDFSYMNFFIPDTQSLVTIGGEFSVAMYNMSENMITLLKLLCQQEGLFLKYRNEKGERILIM